MTKTIEDLFVYLLFITDLLIIVLFFLFIKSAKTQKVLWAIFCYCLIDLAVNYLTEVSENKNLIYTLYASFTALEYSTFAFILWLNVNNRLIRKLIIGFSAMFIVFLAFYYSSPKPRSIDSIPIGITTILILLYSFYYFFEQMNDTKNLFIYNKYQFWVVTGIMIYLAGSFFIYIFANQVDRQTLSKFWFLTNVFYVIKNLFFGIGIFLYVRSTKRTYSQKLHPYLS